MILFQGYSFSLEMVGWFSLVVVWIQWCEVCIFSTRIYFSIGVICKVFQYSTTPPPTLKIIKIQQEALKWIQELLKEDRCCFNNFIIWSLNIYLTHEEEKNNRSRRILQACMSTCKRGQESINFIRYRASIGTRKLRVSCMLIPCGWSNIWRSNIWRSVEYG